jgi:hypothetical protein
VEWDETAAPVTLQARPDLVPDDVAPPQFFADLVEHVLAVSPVMHHVRVRGLRERGDIPVAEADSTTGEDTVVS